MFLQPGLWWEFKEKCSKSIASPPLKFQTLLSCFLAFQTVRSHWLCANSSNNAIGKEDFGFRWFGGNWREDKILSVLFMTQLVSVNFIRTDELSCQSGTVFLSFSKSLWISFFMRISWEVSIVYVRVELFFVVVSFNSFSSVFLDVSLSTNSSYI